MARLHHAGKRVGARELPSEILMSDSNVSVRGARPEDAEALARLSAQLGYPSAPEDMPARLERVERDGTARVFVADLDGETVGLATGHIRHMINHAAPI